MATLEQQIQSKLDELNALKEKQKKLENQQKIIVGSIILKECEKNDNLALTVLQVIKNNASERDLKKLDKTIQQLEIKKANFETFPIDDLI